MSGDFPPRPNDEVGGGVVGQMIQLEPTPSTPAQPLVERVPSLLRPLRNRNYALLFTGQLSSLIGDQLYVVALPFLVLGHAGVRELGLVLMCFGIARIATVPIGGVLADRMDKTKLMLLTDAGRALCVVAVAGLAFGPELSMLTVMALTAVLGGLEGLFLPPSYAILPDILSDDELPAGNALNTALESAAAFVGPALAGLVVAVFTPGVALAIDAVTFVVSAATLLAIRVTPRGVGAAGESDQDTTADGSSRKGFVRFLAVSRIVQLTLLIVLFSNLAFDAMAEVALPVFSRDYLGTGAQGFGVMLSAFGAGAVVGGLLTDALFRVPRRGLIALGLGVVQGTALALVPLVGGGLAGASVLLAASGLTIGVLNAFYMTHLQQRVPPQMLGRTMGALTMATFGAQPVSVLAAGLVLGATGPGVIFVTAGLLIVVGYLLAVPSSEFRNL
jgi:predicted MFS family arabinose efflux permease